MKKIMFLLLINFFLVSAISAQTREERTEQIRSLKVAFFTTELSLTPDEAAKFWPVYNSYQDRQRELRMQRNRLVKDNVTDNLSDKEANVILDQMQASDEEFHQLHKKFGSQLRGILPAVKIIKLKKAEEDFNRKLLREYRENGRK